MIDTAEEEITKETEIEAIVEKDSIQEMINTEEDQNREIITIIEATAEKDGEKNLEADQTQVSEMELEKL